MDAVRFLDHRERKDHLATLAQDYDRAEVALRVASPWPPTAVQFEAFAASLNSSAPGDVKMFLASLLDEKQRRMAAALEQPEWLYGLNHLRMLYEQRQSVKTARG